MKKLLWFLLLVLIAAGAAAAVLYMRVNRPYRGFEGSEQFVEIPQGTGSRRRSASVSSPQAWFATPSPSASRCGSAIRDGI